ncbi:proprotein convertase subtilisin/kexin type 5-like [Ruditapes philippinarum]|uniref:proprotein convertase subtilisin/kexin type 5-like n=1 Tax=Ruditapes philippinarum TaxID=129788 RepID=UPI00295BFD2F|nr:proprotein convertase subtilisin/kexin type 5-like [Ruditapes philippinarum]
MMNAKGLVQKATKWKGVPSKMTCNSGRIQVNKCCTRNVNSTYFVDDCPIQHLEHVQIYVSCEAYWREHTEIHIVSPQGTDTRILRQRKQDYATGRFSWTFMSVHTWGENPKGDWTVRLEDFLNCDNEMTLYSWELILHGTVTDPADGTPKDGILGGHCDKNIQCGDGTNCLLSYNICVNCTLAEHRVINNMCVKDGYGYCNTDIPCQVENAWCNADNTCETCSDGYHAIDGFCKQDGLLGAYCDGLTVCVDPGAWCEPDTDRCLLCPSGYRILEGVCEKDGAVYGYCDTHIPCDTTKTPYLACDPVTSMCINCRQTRQHRIINGFCIKDGAIGGFCSQEISCTKSGSSCDAEFNTCISCTMAGYRSVNGYCLQGIV